MNYVKAVGKDILIQHLRQGTLSNYFEKNLLENNKLFIPFGIRTEIEESLDDEQLSKDWHHLLKEALSQRLVVKTRQKYQLERSFKKLFYNLNSFDKTLTDGEKQLITLTCQHGIAVETKDSKIVKVMNAIKLSPHLKKYTIKLLNNSNRISGDKI